MLKIELNFSYFYYSTVMIEDSKQSFRIASVYCLPNYKIIISDYIKKFFNMLGHRCLVVRGYNAA